MKNQSLPNKVFIYTRHNNTDYVAFCSNEPLDIFNFINRTNTKVTDKFDIIRTLKDYKYSENFYVFAANFKTTDWQKEMKSIPIVELDSCSNAKACQNLIEGLVRIYSNNLKNTEIKKNYFFKRTCFVSKEGFYRHLDTYADDGTELLSTLHVDSLPLKRQQCIKKYNELSAEDVRKIEWDPTMELFSKKQTISEMGLLDLKDIVSQANNTRKKGEPHCRKTKVHELFIKLHTYEPENLKN